MSLTPAQKDIARADRIRRAVHELREAIAEACEHDMIVQLEVLYHNGSEGVLLDQLNGELNVEIWKATSL